MFLRLKTGLGARCKGRIRCTDMHDTVITFLLGLQTTLLGLLVTVVVGVYHKVAGLGERVARAEARLEMLCGARESGD